MRTSYFGMLDLIRHPVAICGKCPDWYLMDALPRYPALAPKIAFFTAWKQGRLDNAGFIREYERQVLAKLDPEKVREEILALYPGVPEKDVTLICYERPNEFCHRHIVSEWFRKNGIECVEFKP